jgi:glucose-1-phosphate thymidylyltransferase
LELAVEILQNICKGWVVSRDKVCTHIPVSRADIIPDTQEVNRKSKGGNHMEEQTLKIAIPMAGLGTRMRPHTWSKPKPLVSIAGRTVLDFVLEQFDTVPKSMKVEYIFIIGPQGEQVKDYMEEYHPDKVVHYVLQAEMRGQSDALYQAREYLQGPMIMGFADTLIETEFHFLETETADAVAWVKQVPDPRRFGVVVVNEEGRVSRLIEKPQEMDNNLAVVGFYYFRSAERLLAAIEEQMRRQVTLKNEFFLADAINIMLEEGAFMHTKTVDVWMDAGTPESVLETNRYLLDNGRDNSGSACNCGGSTLISPVFIHDSATVESSVIGPHVSIGPDCVIRQSIVCNSIVDEGTHVEEMILDSSLIGRNVHLRGQPVRLNLGDESWAMS